MLDQKLQSTRSASPPGRYRNTVAVVAGCMIAAMAGAAHADPPDAAEAKDSESKRLLKLYLDDARELQLYRDAAHRERLELREQPVYIWQNRTRSGGQYGAVFVWTYQGRAELVGTIFSNPRADGSGRAVLHEFHSTSPQALFAVGDAGRQWSSRVGVERHPIPDAPLPAESARSRLAQLRSLARDFSAHSISPYDEGRWELRLLPQPLYRYETSDADVADGAIFAYVTSAGTDPEVLLILEARRSAGKLQWQYAVARFSDFNLFVEHRGRPVWKALRDDDNPWDFNHDRTYRLYTDRILDD